MLYERAQIWMWDDERPVWKLHYDRTARDDPEFGGYTGGDTVA